jgi:hypothetical protein
MSVSVSPQDFEEFDPVIGLIYSSAIGEFVIGLSPIEGAPPGPTVEPPEPINPDIARLYDNVQSVVPGVTLPLLEQELWNTVSEFCIRSTYFRRRVYWEMAPGVSSVQFEPYSVDFSVVWVLWQHGLTNFEVRPPAELYDFLPANASRNGEALLALRPRRFDNLRLGHLPELFTTWFETMLDGVKFRLYGMPSRPWSNTQLATYHGTRYRQGINRARYIAERLHSSQQSPFRGYPYFARGRRKN